MKNYIRNNFEKVYLITLFILAVGTFFPWMEKYISAFLIFLFSFYIVGNGYEFGKLFPINENLFNYLMILLAIVAIIEICLVYILTILLSLKYSNVIRFRFRYFKYSIIMAVGIWAFFFFLFFNSSLNHLSVFGYGFWISFLASNFLLLISYDNWKRAKERIIQQKQIKNR
ncbi:MAG: hypothetical protein ACOC1K_04445 [Nanoarchaeota archaeon]